MTRLTETDREILSRWPASTSNPKCYIAIHTCPAHGFWSVAIEDEEGSGQRITPSKCCGQWRTVRRWELTEKMAERIGCAYGEITGDPE